MQWAMFVGLKAIGSRMLDMVTWGGRGGVGLVGWLHDSAQSMY